MYPTPVADVLIKKMDELQGTSVMYKGLMEHAKKMLKAFFDLSQTHKCKTPTYVFFIIIIISCYFFHIISNIQYQVLISWRCQGSPCPQETFCAYMVKCSCSVTAQNTHFH